MSHSDPMHRLKVSTVRQPGRLIAPLKIAQEAVDRCISLENKRPKHYGGHNYGLEAREAAREARDDHRA